MAIVLIIISADRFKLAHGKKRIDEHIEHLLLRPDELDVVLIGQYLGFHFGYLIRRGTSAP